MNVRASGIRDERGEQMALPQVGRCGEGVEGSHRRYSSLVSAEGRGVSRLESALGRVARTAGVPHLLLGQGRHDRHLDQPTVEDDGYRDGFAAAGRLATGWRLSNLPQAVRLHHEPGLLHHLPADGGLDRASARVGLDRSVLVHDDRDVSGLERVRFRRDVVAAEREGDDTEQSSHGGPLSSQGGVPMTRLEKPRFLVFSRENTKKRCSSAHQGSSLKQLCQLRRKEE